MFNYTRKITIKAYLFDPLPICSSRIDNRISNNNRACAVYDLMTMRLDYDTLIQSSNLFIVWS